MSAQPQYAAVELDGSIHVPWGRAERTRDAGAERPTLEIAPRPVVSAQEFKGCMTLLAGAVVMVTTRLDGRPWGLTISSCCSLTAEPPQLLISLRASTVSCRQILDAGVFGVSILSADQRAVAEFGAAVGTAKFIDDFCDQQAGDTQAPAVAGALVNLDCSVARSFAVGDHRLILGLVRASARRDSHPEPLLYFHRDFRRLGRERF